MNRECQDCGHRPCTECGRCDCNRDDATFENTPCACVHAENADMGIGEMEGVTDDA